MGPEYRWWKDKDSEGPLEEAPLVGEGKEVGEGRGEETEQGLVTAHSRVGRQRLGQ